MDLSLPFKVVSGLWSTCTQHPKMCAGATAAAATLTPATDFSCWATGYLCDESSSRVLPEYNAEPKLTRQEAWSYVEDSVRSPVRGAAHLTGRVMADSMIDTGLGAVDRLHNRGQEILQDAGILDHNKEFSGGSLLKTMVEYNGAPKKWNGAPTESHRDIISVALDKVPLPSAKTVGRVSIPIIAGAVSVAAFAKAHKEGFGTARGENYAILGAMSLTVAAVSSFVLLTSDFSS